MMNMSEEQLLSIVIVTCNQLAYTRLCLDSIRGHTPQPFEIIVVDNGSRDGTVEYLQSQADVKGIYNSENRGYPAAANQGLGIARGGFILMLNNDVIVPAGWLPRLMNPLLEHDDIGLIGPCSNRVSGPQQIPVPYTDLSELDAFAEDLARRHAGELQYTLRLVGFCLLFRGKVLETIGLLDERFGIGNFEDDDFCRRAADAGFKAAIARGAFVHHFGSVTFASQGIDMNGLLRRNAQMYREKWNSSAADKPAPAHLPPLPDSPRLSLCMIVRDNVRTLGPCLASIRPWVDEMIVVDTGSQDNTRDLARSHGAQVFEFPWCDSFAAARNESLRHATGDWIFWMDSDDVIDADNGRKLRELSCRKTAALGFIMKVRCPPRADGDSFAADTLVDHVKMFRNHPSIRFTGRIHEQILPAIRRLGGDVDWTDITVSHAGSDQTAAGRVRKQQRDLRLLELEVAGDPDNSFTLFNLGMTLLDAARPADALNALARSLQLASPAESHCRKIYALLVQAYVDLGRNATALKTCQRGLAVFPQDVELRFRKAQLSYTAGQLSEAEETLRELLTRPIDRYFSSFDQGILGIRAWHTLALIYEKQSRFDQAAEALRKAISFNAQNALLWRKLIDSLAAARNVAELEQLANDGAEAPRDIQTIARSRSLAISNQFDRAVEALEKAMENGASIDVLDELCRLLFLSDRLPAAERWLSELAQRRPDDAAAHLNLAVIHLRRQNYSAAATHAKRSLELRPNHAGARDVLRQATAAITFGALSSVPSPGTPGEG
jgi:GT2 family glycosyltransferase/tetratricopeptide (TPR) repeat protein